MIPMGNSWIQILVVLLFIGAPVLKQIVDHLERKKEARAIEQERDRIFEEMHPIEQQFDAEKKGVAVVIDLQRVTMLSAAAGKQVMEKDG